MSTATPTTASSFENFREQAVYLLEHGHIISSAFEIRAKALALKEAGRALLATCDERLVSEIVRLMAKTLTHAKRLFDAKWKQISATSISFAVTDEELVALQAHVAAVRTKSSHHGKKERRTHRDKKKRHGKKHRRHSHRKHYRYDSDSSSDCDSDSDDDLRSDRRSNRGSDKCDHEKSNVCNIAQQLQQLQQLQQSQQSQQLQPVTNLQDACMEYLNQQPSDLDSRNLFFARLYVRRSRIMGFFDKWLDLSDKSIFGLPENFCPLSDKLMGYVPHDHLKCKTCTSNALHGSLQGCGQICKLTRCTNLPDHELKYCPQRPCCSSCFSPGHSAPTCCFPHRKGQYTFLQMRNMHFALSHLEDRFLVQTEEART